MNGKKEAVLRGANTENGRGVLLRSKDSLHNQNTIIGSEAQEVSALLPGVQSAVATEVQDVMGEGDHDG